MKTIYLFLAVAMLSCNGTTKESNDDANTDASVDNLSEDAVALLKELGDSFHHLQKSENNYVMKESCEPEGLETIIQIEKDEGKYALVFIHQNGYKDTYTINHVSKENGSYSLRTLYWGSDSEEGIGKDLIITPDSSQKSILLLNIEGEEELQAMISKQNEADMITEPCTDGVAIIEDIGMKLTNLERVDDEYVINDYCRFGISTLTFSEDGSSYEKSGGGDARGFEIVSMEKTGYRIKAVCLDYDRKFDVIINVEDDWIIVFSTEGMEDEYYARAEVGNHFQVVKEKDCDE